MGNDDVGTGTVSPRKRNLDLIRQAQQILDKYAGRITLRTLYYQLVSTGAIQNTEKEYKNLSRITTHARYRGEMDAGAIIDNTRQARIRQSWPNLPGFFETIKTAYFRDKWETQPTYCEIWIEKDALAALVEPITYKFGVPLLVCRGQASVSTIYEAAERLKANQGKRKKIFYFGDFDPSGQAIPKSIETRLTDIFGSIGSGDFQRMALTKEQIKEYNLPSFPAKKTDLNYKKFAAEHGDGVVELDALPPDVLSKLVETCITSCIEPEAWEGEKLKELEERAELQEFIQAKGDGNGN